MEKDEAIKILKDFHDESAIFPVRTALETLHPEFRESEDERIRKALIKGVESCKASGWTNFGNNVDIDVVLAWLEKQGTYTKRDVDDAYVEGIAFAKNELEKQKHAWSEEDEKIKKELIELIGCMHDADPRKKRWIAWLEKQDEQKSTDESKFKVGDWVVNKGHSYLIADIDYLDNRYLFEIGGYTHEQLNWEYIENADNKYHLWTIKDAKEGDVLMSRSPFIYGKQCPYGGLNWYNNNFIKASNFIFTDSPVHPATKEQRDLLFQKMHEAGYTFDFEKKELKKIEKNTDVNHEYFSELLENDDSKDINDYAYQVAYCISHDWLKETATWDDVEKACKLGAEWNKRHHKSAWSDEDKKMIGRIRSIVEKYAFSQSAVDVNGDLCEKEYIDADNWLKSIKNRVISLPEQEWKQENTDDLTDFENAMMHIGESFFGDNAGLDPNDIDAIKEQANTLLGLVPSKEWSEEDESRMNNLCHFLEEYGNQYYGNLTLQCTISWLKSLEPQNWTKEDKERYISCLQRLSTGNPEQPETINSKWFKEHVYPQNRWKPSDDDINLLKEVEQALLGKDCHNRLVDFMWKLKKLKE